MFEFLFVLLLFSIGFTLFAGIVAYVIYFIFGSYIGYSILGFGALLCASIFGIIILIAATQVIIDYIMEFKENHKK